MVWSVRHIGALFTSQADTVLLKCILAPSLLSDLGKKTSLHGKRKSGKGQSKRLQGGFHGNSTSQSDRFLGWSPRHPLSFWAPHTMKFWSHQPSLLVRNCGSESWNTWLCHSIDWEVAGPFPLGSWVHPASSLLHLPTCPETQSRWWAGSLSQSPWKSMCKRGGTEGCQITGVETSGDWCVLHILGRTYFNWKPSVLLKTKWRIGNIFKVRYSILGSLCHPESNTEGFCWTKFTKEKPPETDSLFLLAF